MADPKRQFDTSDVDSAILYIKRTLSAGDAYPVLGDSFGNLSIGSAWNDIRYDASDALPNYIGLNQTNGAATSDTTWKVYKMTYSGSDVTRIQVATGSWDGRVALFP